MRIAIIGAGFTGLAAGFELSRQGHHVHIFEKNSFVGGLGSGFRDLVDDYPTDWEWDLEQFYHHWFAGDAHIMKLISELGASDQVIQKRPITASWYHDHAYQLDSPMSLLQFSPISMVDRLRTGAFLAAMKLIPNGKFLEHWTAHDVAQKVMGKHAYEVMWEPLLKGKFAEYYTEINLAWLWARIYMRSPKLAYFEGGFQKLATLLSDAITSQRSFVETDVTIQTITKEEDLWKVTTDKNEETFDSIISTTPFPVFTKLFPELPPEYVEQYKSLFGIGAQALVLSLEKEFLPNDIYWLSIHESEWPFLVVAEHTHFMDKKHYGNDNLLYVGDYLPASDPLMQQDKDELLSTFLPYLQKINAGFSRETVKQSWLWRTPYAQPIVKRNHSQHIPPLTTPLPNV
ncbi:FAD-dependent oxidoreductase, partial [candidate division WWE3 bacterium]|nr:FAD-dependent oxidoreductase [candidate division WWE3 bacterium]